MRPSALVLLLMYVILALVMASVRWAFDIEAIVLAAAVAIGFFVGAASLYLGAVLCLKYEARRGR